MELPAAGFEEPIPDLLNTLHRSTTQFGAAHPRTIAVANRLAVALWTAGDTVQAISLLEEALAAISSCAEHPFRTDLLCTLGEIMVEQARWEQAALIYREVLETCVRRCGLNHASSLAAKGDLAAVLFELGQGGEAAELEREACESAGKHLGKAHPVTCVLAWNRALRLERNGDGSAARAIVIDDLLWLLTEEDAHLQADHRAVKALLAQRYGWETAPAC